VPAHDNPSLHFYSKEQRNLNRHERCVKSCWRTLLTVMTVVGTSQNAHIKSKLAESERALRLSCTMGYKASYSFPKEYYKSPTISQIPFRNKT
jgi:hypothetical protein